MNLVEVTGTPTHFGPSPLKNESYLDYWACFASENPEFRTQAVALHQEVQQLRSFLEDRITRPTNPHCFGDVNRFHRLLGPGDQLGIFEDNVALHQLVVASPEIRTSPMLQHLLAGNLLFDAALDEDADLRDRFEALEAASTHYLEIYNPDKRQRKNRYRQLAERLDISTQTYKIFLEAEDRGVSVKRRHAFLTAHRQHLKGFVELVNQELFRKQPDIGFVAEWYGEAAFRDQVWRTRSIGDCAIRTALWREDEPLGRHYADLPRYSYDYQVYERDNNGIVTQTRKQLKTRTIRDDGRHIKYSSGYIDVDEVKIYYKDGKRLIADMRDEVEGLLESYSRQPGRSYENRITDLGVVAMELAA